MNDPKKHTGDKKEELKEHPQKHEGDPQEDMEGPVSSILQRGKEVIDKIGDKKGHKEHSEDESK
ncbi:hypothetical protein [Niabella beijingensis]|uniref:hypothetical protein n=1 Tax=Niabella beijingensis TaxID=2872700 RepID=UPI001CBB3895|nr:hypothetical protein [Niabella beijingensis]MBZ4188796.1 hypothetical protein [Niabella beijingensis]